MQTNHDITVLADSVISVAGKWRDGVPFIDAGDVELIFGWEVKSEGLCKNDACIPLPNQHGIEDEGHLHLGQVAKLIGHPTLIDSETQTVVIGQPSAVRSSALKDRIAPDFKLPDIHGIDRALSDWAGKKRLLVAFSSW